MAADTKTNAYLLGNATLMMTPFGNDPFALQPATDSIGMVKNIAMSVESDTIELRNGIQQILVDSQKSNVRTTLTAEVYEFSAANLMKAMSFNRAVVAPKRGKLKTALSGASAQTTIVVNTNPLPGDPTTGVAAVGDIPVGATIMIQKADGNDDYVYPARVTAATTVATGDYTVTVAIPQGIAFNANDTVWVVNEIPLGDQGDQDFFSLKIAGTLSNYDKPVVMIIPKVKVSKGFQINFSETDYGSMPFEFTPFYLTVGEAAVGRMAEIGTKRTGYTYMP
jgi:hypothetical protein